MGLSGLDSYLIAHEHTVNIETPDIIDSTYVNITSTNTERTHYLEQPSLVECQPNGQAEIKQNQCHGGSGLLRHIEAKPCGTRPHPSVVSRLRLHIVPLGSAGECDVFIVVRLDRMQIAVGRLNAFVFDDFGHADIDGDVSHGGKGKTADARRAVCSQCAAVSPGR